MLAIPTEGRSTGKQVRTGEMDTRGGDWRTERKRWFFMIDRSREAAERKRSVC